MMRVWLFVVALFLCTPAMAAQDHLDLSHFSRLPVLQDGRIKPLSSFAALQYKSLRDSAVIDGNAATRFLAQALFDPAAAAEVPVIAVRNPHTRDLLGLDRDQKYFSLAQLIDPLMQHDKDVAAWLQLDPKALSKDQNDLLRLYDTTVGMTQILRSFTAVLPLTAQLPAAAAKKYGLPSDNLAYLDFIDAEERLNEDVKAILKKKGEDVSTYSKEEETLAYVSYQLQEIRTAGAGNSLLRVLPATWEETWHSPWDMLLLGQGSPESMKTLGLWRIIAEAYRAGDNDIFVKASAALEKRMGYQPEVKKWRLQLEQFYMNAHLITISLLLYALALILLQTAKAAWGHRVLIAAIAVHATVILARILILARPPVSTLFESTLFVGFVATIAALLAERTLRNGLGATLAAILGVMLQLTTLGFAQNGDTLQMLQAVLNTPFWLATHVIVITAGYGLCLLLALFAHADLWMRGSGRDTKSLQPLIQVGAIAALLLTTVGTILGGLWADQSWGRFWGWDPKENGALFIVLWLTWLMHGKLSGHIKPIAYSAGCAALTIVVALAWFGVNLLATGLHSYGFISGVAGILALYAIIQAGVIAFLWRRAHRHER